MSQPDQYEDKEPLITYYTILTMGYLWTIIEIAASEPFDAIVLFAVTFFLHSYRDAVRKGSN